MSAHDPHDDERDAWLGAALRHAPDAQLAPPTTLSDTILRQARAAVRQAKASDASRPRSAWAAAWEWLARPPVAAGFASLMVATLVGLLWWDRPIDETLERAPAAGANHATRDAPAPAAPPAAASSEAVAPGAPAATRERGLAAPKPELSRAPRAQPHPPAQAVAEATAPAPAAPAAPSPFPDSRVPAPPDTTADTAAAEPRDAATAVTSGALARSAAKAAAPAAAAAQLRREDSAELRPAALAELLDSVAAQPGRWSWQRSEARQPMNPALQGWLLQLDRATAGRWHDRAGPPAGAGLLNLYRDGAPVATLRLGDDTIWLAPASQAGLPRATITGLKQALDDATR